MFLERTSTFRISQPRRKCVAISFVLLLFVLHSICLSVSSFVSLTTNVGRTRGGTTTKTKLRRSFAGMSSKSFPLSNHIDQQELEQEQEPVSGPSAATTKKTTSDGGQSMTKATTVAAMPINCVPATGDARGKGSGKEKIVIIKEAKKKTDKSSSDVSRRTCQSCSKVFVTRNELFRHLRTDPICSAVNVTLAKESMAFLFGYIDDSDDNKLKDEEISHLDDDDDDVKSISEQAGKILLDTIQEELYNHTKSLLNGTDFEATIYGSTLSSQAGQRHRALAQESPCSTVGDVLVVSAMLPTTLMTTEIWNRFFEAIQHRSYTKSSSLELKVYACQLLGQEHKFHAEGSCTQRAYHYLVPLSWLPDKADLLEWLQSEDDKKHVGSGFKKNVKTPNSFRRLKDALRSAESIQLPASKSVAAAAAKTGASTTSASDDDDSITSSIASKHSGDGESPPSSEIKKRSATGRFGALGMKVRRPWHNFADPNLRGDASPNNEPVWRVVDRARMIDFAGLNKKSPKVPTTEGNGNGNGNGTTNDYNIHNLDDVAVVVEIRGDEFVRQQVRRIVGTAIAMTNGWLPENFFNVATRLETFVETPLAPAGRMYVSEIRFHFNEMFTDGIPFFDRHVKKNIIESSAASDRVIEMQNNLLDRISSASSLDESRRSNPMSTTTTTSSSTSSITTTKRKAAEIDWLYDLEHNVTPRIRQSLFLLQSGTSNLASSSRSTIHDSNIFAGEIDAPSYYNTVLKMLRSIVNQGQWPDTSVARSKVIRGTTTTTTTPPLETKEIPQQQQQQGQQEEAEEEIRRSFGSFTVVNTNIAGKTYDPLPIGNSLFPNLVEAIFELEMQICTKARMDRITTMGTSTQIRTDRNPSTHCAVNCNAQFTPHVDSGRGTGQSMSMIVGLGNYVHGELFVEGEAYDIRYVPLEFDGWKLRHWTNFFHGERFSLVWFTPE